LRGAEQGRRYPASSFPPTGTVNVLDLLHFGEPKCSSRPSTE